MPELKLAKLPDRAPVKIMFRASPDLARMLNDYCDAYRAIYEQPDETVEELIPFMLATFMESDPQFKKARKQARMENGVPSQTGKRRNAGASAARAEMATTTNSQGND
jgi:hypothetical protein